MTIWAIADLHLALSVPSKRMDAFGGKWIHYIEKIKDHWVSLVGTGDLVLIAGDISWAMRPEEAQIDLTWIDQLPGTKLILRGNHDYWWSSPSKVSKILPPSLHFLQNNAFDWNDVTIGGARLWDSSEYQFYHLIDVKGDLKALSTEESDKEKSERIFQRELLRLEMSLKCLNKESRTRIAMTHYPPISSDLKRSRVHELLKKYHVNICLFGHLHNLKEGAAPFGESEGIQYILTSADYLDFKPIKIL
jgi:predicted phosphohydrolase